MSHPDEGVLQAVLDGELTAADEALGARGAIEAHLAHCEACRTRLEAMRATMLEADGLVDRLVLPAPERRGAGRRVGPAARAPGRFRLSMGQMGIAAGLLVAVTAGLLLKDAGTPGRQDGRMAGRPELDRPTAGRPDGGSAERMSGDTFRLRAGGVESEGAAEKAEKAGRAERTERADPKVVGVDRPVASAVVPADALMRQAQEGEEPRARVTEPVADRPAAAPAPASARGEITAAEPAGPVAANRVVPAAGAAPAMLGANANARGNRKQLASLAPVRVDSTDGLVRSVYRLGTTEVVLEERPRTAAEDSGARQRPATADELDEVTAKMRKDVAAAAMAPSAEYRWSADGVELVLRGRLTRDSLEALSRLVR
jgi:hypothetical protein